MACPCARTCPDHIEGKAHLSSPSAVSEGITSALLLTGPKLATSCFPSTSVMQKAELALSRVSNIHCSGTLVKGPGDRIFIITARHCSYTAWVRPFQPIGDWAAYLDYKLPCNATSGQPPSFQHNLQVGYLDRGVGRRATGLTIRCSDAATNHGWFCLPPLIIMPQGVSVLFTDRNTDTMVMELHADIPPEWGAYTAGNQSDCAGLPAILRLLCRGHTARPSLAAPFHTFPEPPLQAGTPTSAS